MILYISAILICAAAIITGNYFLAMPALDFTLGYNFLGVGISTLAVMLIDGLLAFICHKLQGRVIKTEWKIFRVSEKEKRVWEALGVKKFKAFLPDLGVLIKFPKGTIANPRDKNYLYRYILESCSGELNHTLSMLLGFLIIFIFPLKYFLCFGIPVAVVNLALNLLPVMSLRYNRYRLVSVYNRL